MTHSTSAFVADRAIPSTGLAGLSLTDRLTAIRETLEGRLVFTTSFGLEDQAITHAIAATGLDFELATLDTGRLFPETYDLWARTEDRYRLRIKGFLPDRIELEALMLRDGINGFRHSVQSRKTCCDTRKVEPLRRALVDAQGWITGLRSEQSAFRAATRFITWDEGYAIAKIAPLADWKRSAVADYVTANRVPCNPLHDRGFLSIGCAPCTRAVRPGETERAGRWWWETEAKRECGLHARPESTTARAHPGASVS
jgi:phosphoadenosine phosphosulfate reductase